MPYQPHFTITDRTADALSQIERLRGFLEAADFTSQLLAELEKRALLKEAHSTTHIEGTQLTLEQSEQILAGDTHLAVDPNDRQELLNYRSAFAFVSTYLDSKGSVTQGLIREIHRLLVANVRGNAAQPGEYRKVQNYVVHSHTQEVIYTPPPAYEVPGCMADLLTWVRQEKEVHPVIVAGIAQFELVDIHPFLDGNGRCARLLSALLLYRTGYDFKRLFSLSEYYDRNQIEYYNAIQAAGDRGQDLTGWVEYFLVGLAAQLQEVDTCTRHALRLEHLAARHALARIELQVLQVLALHNELSINELVRGIPNVSKRTLQRALAKLTALQLVEAHGATNQRSYRLCPLD